MNLKITLLMIFFVLCAAHSFAQNKRVIVEITNVVVNGGKVNLSVFFDAGEFKREEPSIIHDLESTAAVLYQELSLPVGEYLLFVFQDRNNNQRLDLGIFNIPKELFGITNYHGRGFPSRNFDKQKVSINNTTDIITIGLYKM